MSRTVSRASKIVFCIVYILVISLLPTISFPKKADAASIIILGTPTSASTNNATSLVINKPTGVASGDVMVAVIAVEDANPTITSSGWTSSGMKSTQGSTNVAVESFYLRAGSSEPSSYTFNISTSSTRIAGGIVAYRGVVASGNPIEAVSATSTSGTDSSMEVDSITPTTNQSRIIGVYAMSSAAPRTFDPPTTAGVVERVDTSANDGGTNHVHVLVTDYVQTTAAAFTPAAATASGTGDWAAHQISLKPDSTTHMLLFWDGTDSGGSPISSLPSGWSYVTEAEGRFIRGEAPTNYAGKGGQNDHNHNMTTPALGAPSVGLSAFTGSNNSNYDHTHGMPTNTSITATNGNIPSFKTLRLIRYDAGIPNTIPSGAIAIFDDSPGIPSSGWTRQSSQDGFMVKTDSSAGTTGGSDTHTHNITWSGNLTVGGAEQVSNFCIFVNCAALATTTHTHTVSTTQTTSNATTNLPSYIQPLLAKADSDTPVLSIGLTAMFDGTPGGGWVVRSESGGTYYQKFLRPNTTYNQAGGGAPGHTPTGGAKTSSAASASNQNGTNGGTVGAAATHTHVITPTFQTYTSDSLYTGNNEYFLPPYYNVVVAEKVNFIFNHYAWYDDNNAIQVTSRYSSLDVAQDTHIVPVPVGFNPPDLGQELRLRIQVLVNNSSLADAEMQFRLQFAVDTSTSLTTSTCTNGSLGWTDVGNTGGSEAWTYVSGTGHPNDGDLLSTSGGTSIMTPASNSLQRYVRSNSAGTNSGGVSAGQTMEWDYHIINNAAEPATQYRFRLVEDSGILLSQYGYGSPTVTPVCPTLTTRPQPVHQLRHGNFFDNTGNEKGFFWVD